MKTVDCIGNQVACRSHQCDSSLAEGAVDAVVQQGGEIVTNQQGQKHQRYDDVSKAIEGSQLRTSASVLDPWGRTKVAHMGSGPIFKSASRLHTPILIRS